MTNNAHPNINNAGDFFSDFIDHCINGLQEQGLDENTATNITLDITTKLSNAFSGQTFYVSKKPAIFARQMAIYIDLKHMSSADVDRKYGVSAGYSQKINKQIKKMKQQRVELKNRYLTK